MKKNKKKLLAVFYFLLSLILLMKFLINPILANDNLLIQGKLLIKEHCTRCHRVENFNKYGGIDSTPSFGAIKTMSDWKNRFSVFWTLLPHPSFIKIEGVSEKRPESLPAFSKEIVLTVDEVNAILKYVDIIAVADLGEKNINK